MYIQFVENGNNGIVKKRDVFMKEFMPRNFRYEKIHASE